MKALAEASAASENAQFERLIAEKEHAHKEREAEIERKRQQERTENTKKNFQFLLPIGRSPWLTLS